MGPSTLFVKYCVITKDYYGILLPSNNPNSLAALLKLPNEAHFNFMCKLGLPKTRNKCVNMVKFTVKSSWEQELKGILAS